MNKFKIMKITRERLKELEKIEAKLYALEAAGVDNWDGYGIAMEEIEKQEEIDSKIENAVHKAVEELKSSLFEPSERGAGLDVTEEAEEVACNILTKCLNELK